MLVLVLVLVLVLAACAGAPPPPPPPPEPEHKAATMPTLESEIGGMREEATVKAFERLGEPVLDCVKQNTKRVRQLGGTFVISIRVGREGRAVWAYLSESNLGDRATERCILDLARGNDWPKPVGGEGLATRSFQVDPESVPVELEAKRIKPALKYGAKSFAQCRKAVRGRFMATAYVRPDGRVEAAGVAPPREDLEETADCFADTVKKMKFGSPGRKGAKVTFEVP